MYSTSFTYTKSEGEGEGEIVEIQTRITLTEHEAMTGIFDALLDTEVIFANREDDKVFDEEFEDAQRDGKITLALLKGAIKDYSDDRLEDGQVMFKITKVNVKNGVIREKVLFYSETLLIG